MSPHAYGTGVLEQERAEHISSLLNGSQEALDSLTCDLAALTAEDLRGDRGAPLRADEIGRLFLLARDAIRTGEWLARYGADILEEIERAHYEGEAITTADRDGRERRLQAWLEARAERERRELAGGLEAARAAPERRVA